MNGWLKRSGVVVVFAGLWGALAVHSGALLPSDAVAVSLGEFTDDGFSARKKTVVLPVGPVAYLDEGEGPVMVLLHGCPFSAYEWNAVLPALTKGHRVIVPDLLGLGDTPVSLNSDYRLPEDARVVMELLERLGVTHADFVAHDHGGAVLQLLMGRAPALIDRAVMTNVEAYRAWPSEPELPYLHGIVSPWSSPLLFEALHFEAVQRRVFSIAVHDPATLRADVLRGWALPHVATAGRWQRLRRFYRWQLDPEHQRVTQDALVGMRAFEHPVLLVWGTQDHNFGLPIAERLARDIPGVRGLHRLERSAHMPMQEEPDAYARAVLAFLDEGRLSPAAAAAVHLARQQPEQP